MSILDDAFQTYGHQVVDHWFGVVVSIRRKGLAAATNVTATWRSPPAVVESQEDSLAESHTPRIYRIAVAAYAPGGVATEPREGDQVLETIAGVAAVFQVLPDGDIPTHEPSPDGRHWLLRTKRIT